MKLSIEIDVDEYTGNNYKELSIDCKEKLITEIKTILKNTINNARKSRLKKLLTDLQDTSVGKEFDVEILYHLIRSDDE